MENEYSPRSIHRKLSSLRSYCRFLIRRGELSEDPVEKVLKPKVSKRIPQFVDEKSMDRLLDRFEFTDDFAGLRDRLLLNLLYQTGMRRSELVGLRIQSVDLTQQTLKEVWKLESWKLFCLKVRHAPFTLRIRSVGPLPDTLTSVVSMVGLSLEVADDSVRNHRFTGDDSVKTLVRTMEHLGHEHACKRSD